jgi:DNA polymerase-3 subunit epsilon
VSEPLGEAWDQPLDRAPLVLLDLEMTGTDPDADRVCELAAIRVDHGRETTLISLVASSASVGDSERIHGIGDASLVGAPTLDALRAPLGAILEGAVVVGHNIGFDLAFLAAAVARRELDACPSHALDTRALARRAWHRGGYGLAALAAELALPPPTHRAEADARAAGALLRELARALRPSTARDLWEAQQIAGGPRLRGDVARTLRDAYEAQRTVRVSYRVPGRAAFEDELEIWTLAPPRVEGRLRERGLTRVLRGDRLLWAEPTTATYRVPVGFVSQCPPADSPPGAERTP